MTESRSYIESFLDYADAFMFLEHTLLDHKDWLITDGGVRYVNHHWQAYVTFERKVSQRWHANSPPVVGETPMAKKPLYGKILVSRAFDLQEDAKEFLSEMKDQYREAGVSIKGDISRTEASQWKATVYAKVS